MNVHCFLEMVLSFKVFFCVCACLTFSFHLHPSFCLSVFLASIPPLLTPKTKREPATQNSAVLLLLLLGGFFVLFCFVLFFFRKCYYVKSIHTDPGSTGLPPHTGRGGANGKGPVIAEVTHLGLASVSGSWVSSSQEH